MSQSKVAILYTSNTCPKCQLVKNHLQGNLAYMIEKNIHTPGIRKELIARKIMSIPTIIYGDEVILGYVPEKLDMIINDIKVMKATRDLEFGVD